MKIKSVRIENFRSFKDTTVNFNDYICLVGPNGAGKSTILTALNVFFGIDQSTDTDHHKLSIEDFHCKNIADPVKITITFSELNTAAHDEFTDYVRHEELVISAVSQFDRESGSAQVKQFGQRRVFKDFANFFELEKQKANVSKLKDQYNEIREEYPELPPPATKQKMIESLRAYEEERKEECDLIPSEDQFYGFSKGKNRLAKFIQWVYIPAVKDASSEQVESSKSALGKLLRRTVDSKLNLLDSLAELRNEVTKKYQKLLDDNQSELNEVSKSLRTRLSEWAHPDVRLKLQWIQEADKTVRIGDPWAQIVVGEGEFDGELSKFGHGLQRSYLLALLQELAGSDDQEQPTLLLACEEPELYQHPPQARYMAAVLNELTSRNVQIFVSTHSPYFVSGRGIPDLRMVRKPSKKASVVLNTSFDDIFQQIKELNGHIDVGPKGTLAKIHQALQPSLNEMFFTERLILVEGLEDIAYLTTYIHLLEKANEFRQLGAHIVPTNGKSQLIRPLAIAMQLKIPTYVVFDADLDVKLKKECEWAKHERDNNTLLRMLKQDVSDYSSTCPQKGPGYTMWGTNFGDTVKEDIGHEDWKNIQNEADKHFGHAGNLKKNSLHIGSSLTMAWEAGKKSKNLCDVVNRILNPKNYQ